MDVSPGSLLAIDPGLAHLGLSLWGPLPGRRPASVQGYGALCRALWTVHTQPEAPVEKRLEALWITARETCRKHQVRLVVIERPARAGTYRRNQRGRDPAAAIAEGLALHHQAVGVLRLACAQAGVEVRLLPADRRKDAERAAELQLVIPGQLPGSTEHARAAAVLAFRYLRSARYRAGQLPAPAFAEVCKVLKGPAPAPR